MQTTAASDRSFSYRALDADGQPCQGVVVAGDEASALRDLVRQATPLVQERMQLLSEAEGMLAFLFVADDDLQVADDAAASLREDAPAALDSSITALRGVDHWVAADIEVALRAALVEGLGLKPKIAFGPLRVGITGRRISPPLFESMQILGRDSSLARLTTLRDRLG